MVILTTVARPLIAVSRRWPEEVEAALAKRYQLRLNSNDEPWTEEQWRQALRDSDAVCPTVTDRLSGSLLSAAGPRLRVIGNYGVGFEHIDVVAAKARGLVVTNTPEVLTEATADLTMALLLGIARRTVEGDAHLRSAQWTGWRPTHLLGAKVSGQVLGLIGYGRIARAVARRAHSGFGMKVHVFSPRRPAMAEDIPIRWYGTLEELLASADFVSLHCPARPETRHLIDAARMRLMKPGAFLINTARGNIVDELALVAALRSGVIAGAGLDVYEREPAITAGLCALPNTLLLPHLGSATLDTRIAMGMRVLANLDAFFAGQDPPDRIA